MLLKLLRGEAARILYYSNSDMELEIQSGYINLD